MGCETKQYSARFLQTLEKISEFLSEQFDLSGGHPNAILVSAAKALQETADFCRKPQTGVRHLAGSERGVFWKRGLFRKVHFLEILEILDRDSRDFREPPDCGKQRTIRPFSRDS